MSETDVRRVLRAKIQALKDGTRVRAVGSQAAAREAKEVEIIHKTLNVVLAEIDALEVKEKPMGLTCWKCDAQGDTVYIAAESADAAFAILCEKMGCVGEMPRSLVTITGMEELPDGEEYL